MDEHDVDDATLAARVGSDRSTISRIRRGKRRPSWDLAGKIKKATNGAVALDDYENQTTAATKPARRRRRAA